MWRLVAIGVLVSGCASLGRWAPLAEAAAVTTTACDWTETHELAAGGWRTLEESNPILGGRPSTTAVDLYMGAALVTELALGRVLPPWARTLAFAAIAGVELHSLTNNTTWGVPVTCGLRGAPVRAAP